MVAPRQQSGMDRRVEGLHAPVEHLGKAGNLCYLRDRQSGCRECPRRPAGRDQGYATCGQRGGERDNSGFVGNGNERALNHRRGLLIER